MIQVYDPLELVKVSRKRSRPKAPTDSGELEAISFAMFENGASCKEVVMRVAKPLARVQGIYQRWRQSGQSSAIVLGTSQRTRLEMLIGSFDNADELVERIARIIDVSPTLAP